MSAPNAPALDRSLTQDMRAKLGLAKVLSRLRPAPAARRVVRDKDFLQRLREAGL
ncbi:hypothetical protein [Aquabacterium sp.]|uniref:hypothetical protein n=1 Tax=Aquabacterium sp. TaxID=1872578 RepID=UPI002C9CA755|nr:hypothetical protein [Aquabacterium sp.]HSW05883.1 hypothetical protein [Aquabacterium sp.]